MNTKFALRTAAGILVVLLVSACSDDEKSSAKQPSATDSTAAESASAESSAGDTAAPGGWDGTIANIDTRPSGGSDFDPVAAYEAQCAGQDDDELSLECEWLRGLVVADVVEALEAIQASRDKRGTEEALAALDIDDEPEVLVAACRVLAAFPDTPGIPEKLAPLVLASPFLEVRHMAASVLSATPNVGLAAMASQWTQNHSPLLAEDVYDEYPGIPEHYASIGFPVYPGAEWYAPADSDRSVGWSSADAPSVVVEKLGGMLGVSPMGYQAWYERTQQQMMGAMQAMDTGKMAEVQKLIEQYMKTQDPALMVRVEKLQQEISAPMEQFDRDSRMTVDTVVMPADLSQPDQVHYFVAEEKAGHAARVVVVYRQSGLDRTVIQTAWDLRDYPPAWAVE